MQISCTKEDILRGVHVIETAISTRSTLPILSNFLLEVEGKNLKMVSTDLEIGVRCYVTAKITEPGSITVPAKRFGSIVRELPGGSDITIKVDSKSQIDIRAGKSHFVLMGTSKEDFPALPSFTEDKAWVVDLKTFQDMVRKTIFAASTEETRYILNGIYFIVGQGELKLVATDGRRLAYIVKKCLRGGSENTKGSMNTVVPTKTINELLRIMSMESAEEVKFNIAENQIAFQINDIVIISRLIEGTFPNYEQVIPKKKKVNAKIKTAELHTATKQMALLTAEKGNGVKFSFTKKLLKLTTSTQGLGSGEVDLDIDLNGENMEVAFNPNYLIDILKNITEEETLFELNGTLDATVIKPVGDEGYLCVIMPMRLT
jgi:DNA polymerase III subunit beta